MAILKKPIEGIRSAFSESQDLNLALMIVHLNLFLKRKKSETV
jgi:hypothetical protein